MLAIVDVYLIALLDVLEHIEAHAGVTVTIYCKLNFKKTVIRMIVHGRNGVISRRRGGERGGKQIVE